MAKWRMSGELPLDELLEDEVMTSVMSKAGLDRSELRRRLADLARRLAERRPCVFAASERCGAGFH